jgi:RHS repeat-associated protein
MHSKQKEAHQGAVRLVSWTTTLSNRVSAHVPQLSYYRARYYDPSTGRFLGEDPVGFFGGVNFYRYVSNGPTRFIDPFGQSQRDVQRLIDAMHQDVQEMINKGIRNPGKGDAAADENNLEKDLYIITWGHFGKPYLSCNQQDLYLQDHKVGDLFNPKNLDDVWTISEVPGTPFCINGICTHWVLRLTSNNRNDTDLFLDPWRDMNLTVPKGVPYDSKKSH